jgi:hypothetical protein
LGYCQTLKNRFFQAILYSNVLIGLLAFFQILGHGKSGFPLFYCICTALGSITLYNAQRLIKNRNIPIHAMSSRHLWIHQHKKTLSLFVLATLVSTLVLLPFALQEIVWKWWMLIPVLCGLLYTGIPGSNFHGLREIPGLKSFLVAMVWTMLTFYIPYHQKHSEEINSWIVTHQFFFFWVIAIWFDWRDRKYDAPNLFTIPQMAGTKGTIILSLLAWVAILYAAFSIEESYLSTDIGLLISFFGIVLILIKKRNSEFALGFGMDGIIVLQGLILFFLK